MRLLLTLLFFAGRFSMALGQIGCPPDFESSSNLIKNAGFEEGFSSFYSDYKHNHSHNWFSGSIYITDKPSSVHNNYRLCLDTSFKNLGKMLVVDGSENRSQIVWQQTITTEKNTDYFFSCFFATLLKPNPAQLEININGKRLPKPFDYHYQTCKGSTFFSFWNSLEATQATITIRTYTTDLMGNDYVLDNIQFFSCKRKSKPIAETPKIQFDSTNIQIIALGKDSSVLNYKLTFSDKNSEEKALEMAQTNYLTLKASDLYLSIKSKGHFTLQDTLRASSKYKDSITTKKYNLIPIDSGSKFILKDLTFERSSHSLTESSKRELEKLLELLNDNPEISLEIHGHTDNQGDALKNYELSVERVNSVKKFLVENGVSQDRLAGVGFGGIKPVVGYGSEEERRINRRVEFIVIKKTSKK